MAFTIIPGSGTAPTTYEGTDGVDLAAIVSLPNGSTSVVVRGQAANDVINWGITLQGSTLSGGQGDDIITPNIISGATLIGGLINGNNGNDTIGNTQLAVAATISTVSGGQNNDTIYVGNLQSSLVNGNLGDDTITTGVATGASVNTSDSTIFGGQGNDTINVTDGLDGVINAVNTGYVNSLIDGNLGNDIILVTIDNAFNPTLFLNSTIAGGEGDDQIDASTSTVNGTLDLRGGAGNDIVIGSAQADRIEGNDGDDRLVGNGGNDVITGGNGGDIIIGGAGADVLSGGAGVNRFGQGAGSTGNVTLTAGVTTTLDDGDIFTIVGGADTITDWGVAGGANQIATGVLNATFEQLLSGTAATAIAAPAVGANYAIRGTYTAATTSFAVSSAGADLGVFSIAQAAGAVAFTTNAGTVDNFTVLLGQGAAILTSANITNQTV